MANPFRSSGSKAGRERRGLSVRDMGKRATAAMVREQARPGLRSYLLTLPPPSANNIFANRGDGGRRVSRGYKAWLESAGWEVKAQRPEPVSGPFLLLRWSDRPDVRVTVWTEGVAGPISLLDAGEAVPPALTGTGPRIGGITL